MDHLELKKTINQADQPLLPSIHHFEENISKKPAEETIQPEAPMPEEGKISSLEKEAQHKKDSILKYSSLEIVIKYLQFAMMNWKRDLYNYLEKQLLSFFSMYLPITNGKIIDAITKKNEDSLIYYFKLYELILLSQYLVNLLLQAFELKFLQYAEIKGEMLLLENVAKKDIEFFEVFKTGEIVERVKAGSYVIYKNSVLTVAHVFLLLIKAIGILYYLYSFSRALLLSYVVIACFLYANELIHSKWHRPVFKEALDEYLNRLNEFIANIRVIKSFSAEEKELETMMKLKIKSTEYPILLWDVFDNFKRFFEDSDSFVMLFIAGLRLFEAR